MTLTALDRLAPSPKPDIAAAPDSAQTVSGLRILMVTARYFPYMGGTETHVYEVGRRLATAGHEVTILTTNPAGKLPATQRSDGMNIVRVRAWPANQDFYFAPGIFKIISQGEWDIVHCQGYHTLVAPLAMLAAWRAKIPYVLTFHSGGHSSRLRNMIRAAQRELLRPLLLHAARLVGVSNFEADFFAQHLRLSRERFAVIQNGAHLPELDTKPSRDDGITWIVSVGRLERYKGHQRVIAALPQVLEECPNVYLRIAGAGPYEPELRRLVNDLGLRHKVVIGGIPAGNRREMAALLSKASLVTLLSEYEAHPVSVMEALSLGRPVLVTDTSGLKELAERGLVRSIPLASTPAQVADAILEALHNPFVPAKIDLPTWEDCVANTQKLYREVIGKEKQK